VPEETTDESILQMRRALGRQLAALRNRAGLSQWDLAPLTGYSRSTLSDAELGRHRLRREFWVRCDGLLRAENRLIAGFDQIESAGAVLRQRARRRIETLSELRDQILFPDLAVELPDAEPDQDGEASHGKDRRLDHAGAALFTQWIHTSLRCSRRPSAAL